MPIFTVPVELDKPRHMAFTMRAMKAMAVRAKAGLDLTDPTSFNIETSAFVLWQALLHEDKALTLEQVEDMVDPVNLPEVTKAIEQLMARYREANPGMFPEAPADPTQAQTVQ